MPLKRAADHSTLPVSPSNTRRKHSSAYTTSARPSASKSNTLEPLTPHVCLAKEVDLALPNIVPGDLKPRTV